MAFGEKSLPPTAECPAAAIFVFFLSREKADRHAVWGRGVDRIATNLLKDNWLILNSETMFGQRPSPCNGALLQLHFNIRSCHSLKHRL